MKITVGAKTDVGKHRRGNEDAYLVQSPLFGVADGMGGHLAGDVASATAIGVISDGSRAGSLEPDTLKTLLQQANSEIWSKASSDPSLSGMGTTCTLLVIEDGNAHLAHVGDSRAYLLRGGTLEQMSEDHTLVARMVREGRIRSDEAQHHPQRNVITRALGVDEQVEVDVLSFELEAGDRIILCSDGLTSMVENDAIRDALASTDDPQEAAEALVDAANAAGGEDNITVVVVDVAPGDSFADLSRGAGDESERAVTVAQPRTATPVQAQARVPDAEHGRPTHADAGGDEPPARRSRRVLAWVLGIALVVGGGYAAARVTLANSWYVGANEEGVVTIYRGIPEEFAGLDLSEKVSASGVAVEDLPQFLQEDVEQGIKKDSLADAEATVADLEDRARDFGQETSSDGTRKKRSP
ncbi:MAG: Stp1/IreP family PP2C-type Ser/Thr phosphatase [Actinomycetota bacterium]